MRRCGLGLVVVMLGALGAAPALANGGGAPFDGRVARKALAERYEKVQREKDRSWQDDEERAPAPPDKLPVGASGTRTPESPRERAVEPPRTGATR